MNCNYECNGELKRELRNHKITYEQIAKETFYSVPSVKKWFSSQISSEKEMLVKRAINRINIEKVRLDYEKQQYQY